MEPTYEMTDDDRQALSCLPPKIHFYYHSIRNKGGETEEAFIACVSQVATLRLAPVALMTSGAIDHSPTPPKPKRQKLIDMQEDENNPHSTYRESVQKHLDAGWKIVPGTLTCIGVKNIHHYVREGPREYYSNYWACVVERETD